MKTNQLRTAFLLFKLKHNLSDQNYNVIRPPIADDDEDPFGALHQHYPVGVDELEHFLQRPLIDRSEDILQWWKRNSCQYPNLSCMARIYLAIPATSTASERVFSIAGNLISEKRTRLSSDSIQAGMTLRSWQKAGLI